MGRKTEWTDTISAFAVGVGVGAALGMLFAPKTGEETREFLSQRAKEGVDQAVAKGRDLADRAQSVANDAAERVQGAVDAGTEAYRKASSASD